jgi:ABC-2 type transport system ATP-binding protein
MLYTSHNMYEIERMCDRVLFLAHGTIVAAGSPRDVLAQARTASLEEAFIRIAQDGTLRNVVEEVR